MDKSAGHERLLHYCLCRWFDVELFHVCYDKVREGSSDTKRQAILGHGGTGTGRRAESLNPFSKGLVKEKSTEYSYCMSW
jgi:hypothetical protein